MKNKKLIIGLSISIPLLIIIVVIVLILLGIIPNPFLDTSDLVCYETMYEDETVKEVLKNTFEFDKFGYFTIFNSEYTVKYNNLELAQNNYKDLIENENIDAIIDENVVIVKNQIKADEYKSFLGKKRKEIKKIYEHEFFYDCE